MQDFDLYLPTHIVFGKDKVNELPKLMAPFGKKVLLTYGGGSIKKIGLYDKIKDSLKDAEIFELSGIEPNPKIGSIRQGVKLCKEHNIDVILAVGGGSVLDASKNIAAGAFYDGDPWDLVKDNSKVGKSLPIVTILTLSATGSEYDASGVISNPETQEKLPIFGDFAPRASILDPVYTYTVPKNQTAAGACDIMSHTFEQYLVKNGNMLTDGFCESMLRTVIKYAPIAIKDPQNYEARAALMQASSFGCCGLLNIGRDFSPWPVHGIEHEVSAYTDITHGVGLAIITPRWMRYSLNEITAPRFAQYGVNVWGLDKNLPQLELANKAIEKTEEFFKSLGLPSSFSEIGIDDKHFEDMAKHLCDNWGDLGLALTPLTRDDIVAILRNCL